MLSAGKQRLIGRDVERLHHPANNVIRDSGESSQPDQRDWRASGTIVRTLGFGIGQSAMQSELPEAFAANGVARMIQHSPSPLLVLLAISVLTSPGCQTNRDWPGWLKRDKPVIVNHSGSDFARRDALGAEAYEPQGMPPGHSTEPDEFNESYAPYDEQPPEAGTPSDPPAPALPREAGRFDRLFPPLVPPSRAESDSTNQNPQRRDVRFPKSAASQRLIKVLRSPPLFSPGEGRSIYDRLRGADPDAAEKQTAPRPRPDGPIAQLPIHENTARACQYSEPEKTSTGPVTLGLPEPVTEPTSARFDTPREGAAERPSHRPVIMQASPSSFKHPLLADPTGVPYRTLSDH